MQHKCNKKSELQVRLYDSYLLGWLIDVTGNYSGAFLIAGFSAAVATVLGFTIAVLSHYQRRTINMKRQQMDLEDESE
jgi:hypothetical protein